MAKEILKLDMLDEILVDLYEQDGLFFYCSPSPVLTGQPAKEQMIKISELAETPPGRAQLKPIFKAINRQVEIYYKAVIELKENKFIKVDNTVPNHLYRLQLTVKGNDMAKLAIKLKWEYENTLTLRKASNQNKYLTAIIAFATVVNVLVASGAFSSKTEPIPIELNPTIQIDEVIVVPDSTVMKIEIPQIEKEGS